MRHQWLALLLLMVLAIIGSIQYPLAAEGGAGGTQALESTFRPGNWQDTAIVSRISMRPANMRGLAGELYLPNAGEPRPAIITLGACVPGSARGSAQGLADHGYVALALFYCGVEAPFPQLQEIPLEYFRTAIDWLRKQKQVDPKRLGIFGVSAGGQAALLVAAHYPEITAVVGVVPSSFVTQALPLASVPTSAPPLKSFWTLGGNALPFVPNDAHGDARNYQGAIIPIERVNGSILLISRTNDLAWPSSSMSEQVMERLKANNFRFSYQHLRYQDAGHVFFAARDASDSQFSESFRRTMEAGMNARSGGTTVGNQFAQADSWPKILRFFQESLGS